MTSRLFHGDDFERGAKSYRDFEPITEGHRHQLAPDVLLAIWKYACREATDAGGQRDEPRARELFHQIAARIAARGGRLRPDIGKLTRVGAEINGDMWRVMGANELAPRIPGRITLVLAEARRWMQIAAEPAVAPVRVAAHDVPEVATDRDELPGASEVARAMAALQARLRTDDAVPPGIHAPALSNASDLARTERAYGQRIEDLAIHTGSAEVSTGELPEGGSQLPYRAQLEQSFGEDFGDVDIRLGASAGSGRTAYATFEGGRDVIVFDQTSPSQEQVAHELVHVVQRRRFGDGPSGVAQTASASEVEARDLAPLAAAGQLVQVRSAPAARVQCDADVAQRIYDNLHGWVMDDEAAALRELQNDTNRAATIAAYRRFGVTLWADFIANASGDTLHRALALCWPHMTLIERLETHLGTLNDDEAGILQTINAASDAELQQAAPNIERFLAELSPIDRFAARSRIWPGQAVDNVVRFLHEGDGWIYDDEGPVATAILRLTPAQRADLWQHHQDAFGMFSESDLARIRRICVGDDGRTPATEADALGARMELATEGAGTDEEGVMAAVGVASARRDELASIEQQLRSRRGADGQPLSAERQRQLERRKAELDGVGGLLTVQRGADGQLDENSFLGRVQGDMDAASVDAALGAARVDQFERAKQALLNTESWTSDVDEDAVLRILHDITGELTLGPGETIDSLPPAEVTQRRARSAADIVARLRADPQLHHIFSALDSEEYGYTTDLAAGDRYQVALRDLGRAFHVIDTDEAAILRVIRDASPEDRARMQHEAPEIIAQIRQWAASYPSFLRAFEQTLETGTIPSDAALDEAMGNGWDGTNVELVNQTLAGLSPAERHDLRRGYLLAHRPRTGPPRGGDHASMGPAQLPPELSPADQALLDRYNALHARLESELGTNDLDAALVTMLDIPTVDEMRSEDPAGRLDAAEIMLYRQRERLELTAGVTDIITTDDDTAAAAHIDYESHYNQFIAGDNNITPDEFAILVRLDTVFNDRFTQYQETANMAAEIAGSVAAVVAATIVIIATEGTAAPGVIAWLSANSTLIGGAAAASALSQVVAAEAAGGSFHDTLGVQGAREALSGAINGALAVCGTALAERAATLIGLSGEALTATIARAAADSIEISVAGRAFARGAIIGLIDGSLGGAASELAMTLTDAQTWRHTVWGVLARAGEALLHGGALGGAAGAVTGGIMETATRLLQQRTLTSVCRCVIDDSLGTAGHIDVHLTEGGTLEGMTLRFGRDISEADLAAHVERVRVIDRAGRILGRVANFLQDEPTTPAGTNAGNAAQEVRKIRQMIQSRLRQLSEPMEPQARQVIEAELDVLDSNLTRFERVAQGGDLGTSLDGIGSPRAPDGFPAPPDGHYYRRRPDGTGWEIARRPNSTAEPQMLVSDGNGGWRFALRATTPDVPDGYPPLPEGHYYRRRGSQWDLQRYPGSDAEPCTLQPDGNGGWTVVRRDGAAARAAARFDPGTTREAAFEALTGENSTSSFRQYWDMLRENGLATREEVLAAMLDPAEGRTVDAVRHGLKETFEPRVLARAERTAAGVARTEAESMAELRRLTAELNPSDRGNIMETWYAAHRPNLTAHPTMTDGDNPGLVVGRNGRGERTPDYVEGQTIVEMKATRVGLNDDDIAQINDGLLVSLRNGVVRLPDDTTQVVDSLRLVFSDVRGARGSVEQLERWLVNNPHLTIEVFGTNGAAIRISRGNMTTVFRDHNVTSLTALLGAI